MRNDAETILNTAALRSDEELLRFCRAVRVTRAILRELHVIDGDLEAAAKDMAISLGRRRVETELANCGIEITASDFDEMRIIVERTKSDERQAMTGAYVVRDIAVSWLLDGRQHYFDQD